MTQDAHRGWISPIRLAAVGGCTVMLFAAACQKKATVDAVAPELHSAVDRPAGQAPGGQPEPSLQERNRLWPEAKELAKHGRFDEAAAIAEALLALERQRLGPDHEDVDRTLEFLAHVDHDRGALTAELAVWKEILECRRRRLGEGHWRTVDARWAVATAERTATLPEGRRRELAEARRLEARVIELYGAGRYAEALPEAQRVVTARAELLGGHPDHAVALNNLAELYRRRETTRRPVRSTSMPGTSGRRPWARPTPTMQCVLNNLAALYQDQGDYASARPLFERARDIRKAALGEDHPIYATSLNNLAALYKDQGDYASARPLYEHARDIWKAALGEAHPDYAMVLNNLAALYKDQGDYASARPLFERARDIRKAALGEDHPIYATSLNNLAALYKDQGDYASARPLYERARDIWKAAVGEDHPGYAMVLNNLAELYQGQGDYKSARPLYERARDIIKAALGEAHPEYALALNNLASLYQAQGDYASARPLFERARDIWKAALGDTHPDYALALNNLASLYQAQGDYASARPLFERARDIRKVRLGEAHPDYALALSNLAMLYEDQGDYASALPLYERARDIWKAALGEAHPDYATALNNLASLHLARGAPRRGRRPAGRRPPHHPGQPRSLRPGPLGSPAARPRGTLPERPGCLPVGADTRPGQ